MLIGFGSRRLLRRIALSLVACAVWTFPSSQAAAKSAQPIIIHNVDEPARAPYHASVRQFCFASDDACDFLFPAVPAGKRLVVTQASGYFASATNAQYVFVSIQKNNESDVFLPALSQGCGGDINCPNTVYVFNQATQAVYDDGEEPTVRITTGSGLYPILSSVNPALPFMNTVTLTGHFVDCVAASCDPIAP